MKELLQMEQNFQRGRMLIIAVFTCALVICVTTLYFSYQMVDAFSQRIYLINRGDAIEATCGDVSDNRPAEARYQVTRFHELFFSVSPDPKAIEDNTRKALFLADGSAKRFYDNLQEQGYYRQMIEGNVSQKVDMDSVQVDMRVYPYKVVAHLKITQNRSTAQTIRQIVTVCDLEDVNRSENSPNGFLIRNFHMVDNQIKFTTNQ